MEQIPEEWLVNNYSMQPDYKKATKFETIEACCNENEDEKETKDSE
jgi:hypothetical protein